MITDIKISKKNIETSNGLATKNVVSQKGSLSINKNSSSNF